MATDSQRKKYTGIKVQKVDPQALFLPLMVALALVHSSLASADSQFKLNKAEALQTMTGWHQEVIENSKLSKRERNKELALISRLQLRVEKEATLEITASQLKEILNGLLLTNQQGENHILSSDGKFIALSAQLLEDIEPKENPLMLVKTYMAFASVENPKSVASFETTRSYTNHEESASASPKSLDQAAGAVEKKIFKQSIKEEDADEL